MTNLRSNPKSEFIPDDDENAPARRRRARRVLTVLEGDEREHLIDELAHRTTASLDFYILSFIAGILFSLGIFFNSPALFVFGAVIAPIMNPIIGISIGIVTGSNRFFLNSFIGLLIGIVITFSIGIIAGLINGMYAPTILNQAYISTRFSWELLSALSICTAITTWIIAQDRNMAVLPSAMIAYSLYLPSTVAGFGFGSKTLHLFPDGLVIFAAHFALACLISAITLALMGYRPQTLFGYTIGGAFALLSIIILIGISVTGVVYVGRVTLPTYTPTLTPSLTPTITPSLTPPPPTVTPTLTLTPTLTATPTLTPTSTPTPILVFVKFPDGAKVRLKPNYSSEIVEIIANGTTLHVLDNPSVDTDQRIWIHVTTPSGKSGWIWQALLVATTPVP